MDIYKDMEFKQWDSVRYIKVIFLKTCGMVKANLHTLMVQYIKEIGYRIVQMEKVLWFIHRTNIIRDNGKIMLDKEKESLNTVTDLFIKVNGIKTISMEMEIWCTAMVINTMDNGRKVCVMD